MNQTVLMSLDMFLDTRLATLAKIDSELAAKIMEDKSFLAQYSTRPNDHFVEFGIGKEVFAKVYAQRDKDTLKLSRPTRFYYEITRIAKDLITSKISSPYDGHEISFLVNTYPYADLTTDEIEAILAAIYHHIPDIVKVSSIYLAPGDITPSYIRDADITGVFMYDFAEWLGLHFGENLSVEDVVENPQVTICTPLLFNDLNALQEANEFENPDGVKCDITTGIRVCFAAFFEFSPLNTMLVSITTPEEVVKLTEMMAKEAAKYKA